MASGKHCEFGEGEVVPHEIRQEQWLVCEGEAGFQWFPGILMSMAGEMNPAVALEGLRYRVAGSLLVQEQVDWK